MGIEQPKSGSMEALFNGSQSSFIEALARRAMRPPETLQDRDNVLDEDTGKPYSLDEQAE